MGLLFTPTLSWTSACEELAKQARKAICSIKQFQKPFGYFTHADIFILFDSMISPILTFGSEIWGITYSEVTEKIQVEFCKYFMGVNSTVNNSMVLGDCGRLPLCVIYFSNSIKFWCKLLRMPITKCASNCYL